MPVAGQLAVGGGIVGEYAGALRHAFLNKGVQRFAVGLFDDLGGGLAGGAVDDADNDGLAVGPAFVQLVLGVLVALAAAHVGFVPFDGAAEGVGIVIVVAVVERLADALERAARL